MKHKTGIRRLTTQLVLSMLLFIFLPSAIALTALVYTIRSDFKEQAVSNALAQIENKSASTVNALDRSIASLRLLGSGVEKELNAAPELALRVSSGEPPAAWPDTRLYRKVYQLLKSELIRHAGTTEARIINSAGKELVRLVLTPSGAEEKAPNELENKAHRAYFKNTMALSGTDVYLHPVTLQKEYKKIVRPYMPVLRISTKLTMAGKESFGMVVINIRPEFIFGLQLSGVDSGFLIADEKGSYLVHWDKSALWGGELGRSANLLADEPEMKQATLLREEFLNKDSAIQYDRQHDEYHAWKKIHYDETDRSRYWIFFQRHPLKSIEAPWGRSATIGLAGFILIILSGFGLIVLIIKKTLEPLPRVASAMKSLEDGDLSARADIKSRSEIGEIAHAFNSMADWLENYRRQLQKSMAISSAMSDTTPNAHIIIKQNGQILSANRATEKIFGYTPDELKGRDVKTLMPAPYNEKGEDYVWDYLEGGADTAVELGTVELNAMRKSGEVFKVSVYLGEAEIGEEGVFVAVIEDITERKRAEAELKENEAKYHNLFKSASDAIYLIDPVTARILDCNHKAAEMDGYSVEELKGMTVLDLHPEEERRLLPGMFKEVMDKGEVTGISDLHHKKKDGSLRPIEVNATIIDIGGKRLNLSVVRDITERKQAEEELLSAKALLEKTFASLNEAVFIVDPPSRTIISSNPAMERIFGYSEEEVLGHNTEFLHVDRLMYEEFGRKLFPALDADGVFNTEYKMRRKDGTVFLTDHTVTAIKDELGNRTALVSVIRDITEREKAEDAIINIAKGVSAETGEEFFRSLVRYLAKNLGSAYAFVGELTGEKSDSIATIAVCVDGEIKDNFEYTLSGTPCINVVGKVPCVYPEKVRQEFPEDHMLVEMSVESYMGTPLFDSNGTALGLLVVMDRKPLKNRKTAESMLQIFAIRAAAELERKRAEEELRKRTDGLLRYQSELYELAKVEFKDLPSALENITEVAAKTLEVEQVGVWVFTEDRTEIICQNLYKLGENRHEKGTRLAQKEYPNYFKALGESRIVVASDVRSDPRTMELNESYLIPRGITSLMDASIRGRGKIAGIVCHEHIGPRRGWTMEEQDFAASIADMVSLAFASADRFRAEEALKEAKKVAEEANETKTRFVAKTNHELRGPLTSIISMLKLILAGKCENPEQEKEFLKNVYNSSIHLRGLIEHLLDLSVLDIGKMKLNMKVVPFDRLLELVRQITWMQAEEKGLELTITCDCTEDNRMVYCDPDRLRELVVNLVGNAIKFTEKGSIKVSCSQPPDETMMKFEIVDTGIGIEPERQKGLFEPFSQVDGAHYGGAGLGLTVAKKFVERMGGKISIYSQGLGHGTRVTISLPQAPAVKKKKTPAKKRTAKKS